MAALKLGRIQQTAGAGRLDDVAQHLSKKRLQAVRPSRVQRAPAGIESELMYTAALAFQLLQMFLGPFGRAHQPELLAVPQRQHDGPLGLPALLAQHRQRARGFEQHRRAAGRIATPR